MNDLARLTKGRITFDPTIISKDNLSECIRIFTDPHNISNNLAQRLRYDHQNNRHENVIVYTNGTCTHNGRPDAQCGSRIWFGPQDQRNRVFKVPGSEQSN